MLEVKLRYIEGFGKLLFGLYNVAARILFLNMLIAMMSKSFNVTVVRGRIYFFVYLCVNQYISLTY